MSTTIVRPRGLRVGELAKAAGVAPDTVRYYERAGLLPPPARTAGGYRAYDASAVDRLKFIQGAQRLARRSECAVHVASPEIVRGWVSYIAHHE